MPAPWLPDINVLVYAMRRAAAEHAWALGWLRERLEAGEPVAVHEVVLAGVLRIATAQRRSWEATPLTDATGFLQSLVDHPSTLVLPSSGRTWPVLRRLCQRHGITGKRISDAFLAACAIDAGCCLVTADSGFVAYAGLTWLHLPGGQLRTNPT